MKKLDSWELVGKSVEVDGMKGEGVVVGTYYDAGGAGLLYNVEKDGKIVTVPPVEIRELVGKK